MSWRRCHPKTLLRCAPRPQRSSRTRVQIMSSTRSPTCLPCCASWTRTRPDARTAQRECRYSDRRARRIQDTAHRDASAQKNTHCVPFSLKFARDPSIAEVAPDWTKALSERGTNKERPHVVPQTAPRLSRPDRRAAQNDSTSGSGPTRAAPYACTLESDTRALSDARRHAPLY